MTAIDFRLLGEVGARSGGRLVDIGHARQRCLLAVLLIDANRVVSVDQLLERVWSNRLPQRARSTLSSYLSRLRQVLAIAPDVAITRKCGGYLLSVDPGAVDLHRFRSLLTAARRADDEQAHVLFERAFALWRGDALSDLDTPWLNATRSALAAERLAAELDRNDLALAHGRHTGLLAELSARTAAHPMDERLAGQLILAQYRSGRQADALRTYEQLRVRLAEELGADPSPPLRILHTQILTADAALPRPVESAVSVVSVVSAVPRQLPAPPRAFVGRVDELSRLDRILAGAGGSPAVVTVVGTAGVGKTSLAVGWGHRVADGFADGQLYVDLRGFDPAGPPMSPAAAVRDFLDALGVPAWRVPIGVRAQTALYRSLLTGRRMLVVLDDARDAEQVRPLLPGTPGCVVVVTSRNQLPGLVADGAYPLPLGLLGSAEARDLLAGHLGEARLAREARAVDDIVARCARLPLALAAVAARAVTHPDFPLAALADELRDARSALDAIAAAAPEFDLRAEFGRSYATVGDGAARLFRLIGLYADPDVSVAAAAHLTGSPVAVVRPLLAELARAHLLTERLPGRFVVHDLLRAYAVELATAVEHATVGKPTDATAVGKPTVVTRATAA